VWGGDLAQSVACGTVNSKVWGSVPTGTATWTAGFATFYYPRCVNLQRYQRLVYHIPCLYGVGGEKSLEWVKVYARVIPPSHYITAPIWLKYCYCSGKQQWTKTMYVCTYVHTYVCMYVCVCVCVISVWMYEGSVHWWGQLACHIIGDLQVPVTITDHLAHHGHTVSKSVKQET
jgi:hypothetical protein